MTNVSLTALILLSLVALAKANGSIELIVRSPVTVVIEPTVCAEFECNGPDEHTPARKVAAGVPLRFHTARYQGQSLEHINVFLKVIEPTSYELIASELIRPKADNAFITTTIVTDLGFNVTLDVRNHCSENIYGKRCDRRCESSDHTRAFCDLEGVLKCRAGWSGPTCSKPFCSDNCNGRGDCTAPGKCVCRSGFMGPNCETCIPKKGCDHGTCFNGIPDTCACKPGFTGELCNIDSQICTIKKPCQNGGECSLDVNSNTGYRCKCPFDFLGNQCEMPLSSAKCSVELKDVCKNGGTCFSLVPQHVQCRCRPGFTGQFCEQGEPVECSAVTCPDGQSCRLVHSKPVCIASRNERIAKVYQQGDVAKINGGMPQQAIDEIHTNTLFTICILLICVGLCFAMYTMYTRVTAPKQFSTPPIDPPAPLVTLSSNPARNPPVYKVCIVSEECGGSSSDAEPFYNSPPPAYSSPIMPRYKKIPTDNESTQDCVV